MKKEPVWFSVLAFIGMVIILGPGVIVLAVFSILILFMIELFKKR